MKLLKKMGIIVMFCTFLTSCVNNAYDGIKNINIYKDTVVWNLAKAVNAQDTKEIRNILKNNPELANYKDPEYGTTLLIWAVGMEKYNSVQSLLECGADPNILSDYRGGTALYEASGYSWIDSSAKKDAKYVKLLLEHGADPNIAFIGNQDNKIIYSSENGDRTDKVYDVGKSPLIESIGCGLDKTRILVEYGADINYKMPDGKTAAIYALMHGSGNKTTDARHYAHYLIVECRAKVTDPYMKLDVYEEIIPNEYMYPVDILRRWVCDLDSEDYQLKLDIIEEFKRQGVNYYESPISGDTLEKIKKLYPNTWEEYIKVY